MVFEMAQHGTTFSTRPTGVELRAMIEEQAGHAEAVVIDFRGVLDVSSSFADEFIGELAAERPTSVVGASAEVQRVVTRVLDRRSDQRSVVSITA